MDAAAVAVLSELNGLFALKGEQRKAVLRRVFALFLTDFAKSSLKSCRRITSCGDTHLMSSHAPIGSPQLFLP